MGQFIATHTSYVEGGRKFGEKLAELPSVEKVHADPMTGRAPRRPRIIIKKMPSDVEVTLGAGNGHQRFFVHPRDGVGIDELSLELTDFCWALRGYEVTIPQNGDKTTVRVADLEPEEPVTVRYEFKLTLEEAEALVLAIDLWGGLPIEFPSGSREEFGVNLWSSLKNHAYVSADGYGRAAISRSDRDKFDATQFVVFDRQGKFRERWKERDEASWFPRSRGEWITEIRGQCRQSQKPPEPEPEKPRREDLRTAIRSFSSQLDELTAIVAAKMDDLTGKEAEYKKLGEEIEFAKLEIEELKRTEEEVRRQIEQTEALQARLDGILRPKF